MRSNVDLFSIEVFLAVCQEGSFAEAARRLFVSEPAVSMRIRSLERQLGLTLFVRSHRGARPTRAGSILREGAQQTLARLETSIQEAQAAERGIITRLYFWLPANLSVLLPDIFRGFAGGNPHVELMTQSEAPGAVLERLANGDVDCAVIADEQKPHLNGFESTPILQDQVGLALSASHPLASQATIMPEDLAPYRLFIYQATGLPLWQSVRGAFAGTSLRVSEVLPIGSPEGLKELVKAGLGVAFLSHVGVLQEVERGDVVFRSIRPTGRGGMLRTMWFTFARRHVLGTELVGLREELCEAGLQLQMRLNASLDAQHGYVMESSGSASSRLTSS